MRNEILLSQIKTTLSSEKESSYVSNSDNSMLSETGQKLPEILFISTFPPRECGIATYSQDLIQTLNTKFNNSFQIKICPLISASEQYEYPDTIEYVLNTANSEDFEKLATTINANVDIQLVLIQHEFGLFKENENSFKQFLHQVLKPIIIVFHTILPNPDELLKIQVHEIAYACENIVVMTKLAAQLLMTQYGIASEKIIIIPHGTHLISHSNKELLKSKHQLSDRKVLSTFGLLSSGKNIETTLNALPEIVKKNPAVIFLIIGKTHPSVVKSEGEKYRQSLENKVIELELQNHVKFINSFLPLPELLDYLQLTDIYLFTSNDPNQAVSGTFSYAISCGCPIICTPIPHANEVLKNDTGITINFGNSEQLSSAAIRLLENNKLREDMSSNSLHRMASTAWENAAIAHAMLFKKNINNAVLLNYSIPKINLDHIKKLTTNFGIIQFSNMNQPDINSGYTLDDCARALIAMCEHYEITQEEDDLKYISIYLKFIQFCQQPEGYFLNYVDEQKKFTKQNTSTNLADANGRAIWALGYLISKSDILPIELVAKAESVLHAALPNVNKIYSTRAMAFVIKGLYYSDINNKSAQHTWLIRELANRLVQMYKHEADNEWQWFESYLTYANSILSEAMLCAWLATGDAIYKEIAKTSFDFLLSLTIKENEIKVISNKTWLHKSANTLPVSSKNAKCGGEQPIDVAYTILALSKFNDVFDEEEYLPKMKMSFNWFLGNNCLNQIIYNPCTGGCYDGLEEDNVNLNQGAESTVSYLMARLSIENLIQTSTKRNTDSFRKKRKFVEIK